MKDAWVKEACVKDAWVKEMWAKEVRAMEVRATEVREKNPPASWEQVRRLPALLRRHPRDPPATLGGRGRRPRVSRSRSSRLSRFPMVPAVWRLRFAVHHPAGNRPEPAGCRVAGHRSRGRSRRSGPWQGIVRGRPSEPKAPPPRGRRIGVAPGMPLCAIPGIVPAGRPTAARDPLATPGGRAWPPRRDTPR